MQVIEADETRMIDLQGVGPCPRPVDIHTGVTGFTKLKSLRIYRFVPGAAIHGDSEGDEVFILPLSGAFDMAISGARPLQAVVGEAVRAVYMPPGHSYVLTPLGPVTVAYARVEAVGLVPTQALGGNASVGVAEHLSYRFVQPGLGFEVVGEALVHVIKGQVEAEGLLLGQGQTLAVHGNVRAVLRALGSAEVLVIAV